MKKYILIALTIWMALFSFHKMFASELITQYHIRITSPFTYTDKNCTFDKKVAYSNRDHYPDAEEEVLFNQDMTLKLWKYDPHLPNCDNCWFYYYTVESNEEGYKGKGFVYWSKVLGISWEVYILDDPACMSEKEFNDHMRGHYDEIFD